MSTYTTNDGLEKPAVGTQAGTWGTTMNRDLDLIDAAIDGVVAVDIAGLSAYALDVANGTASNGRNKVIVFSGTPSTGIADFPVTITPNTVKKIYYITNRNGGLGTITVSQGSGSSITIPYQGTAFVYCDGAGAGASVVSLFGNPIIPDGSIVLGTGGTAYPQAVLGDNFYVAGSNSGVHYSEMRNSGFPLKIVSDNSIELDAGAAYGVQIAVASTPPTDANIPNGHLVGSVDQVGNTLKLRVRYSDGTLKTATLALV